MPETTTSTIRRPAASAPPSKWGSFDDRKAKLEEALGFGLGGCACQETWELPADYDLDKLRCTYDRLPQAILVPGGGFARLVIQPTIGSNYFCPIAWLATVKDAVDPQLSRSLRITDVTIGPCTLLPFSNTAPTAATLQFIDTDELDPAARDNCACPTPSWPCFSTAALNCQLTVTLFNANPAGVDAIANVEVLGRSISSCLDWKQASKQKSASQMPPTPSSTMPMP